MNKFDRNRETTTVLFAVVLITNQYSYETKYEMKNRMKNSAND